jgi:hypothetical protein
MISRSEVLSTAERLVNGDRDQAHGAPALTFQRIADLWSVFLGVTITPAQVAELMILFKLARLSANPQHADSWIDIAGYAACGGEVAGS